MGLRQRTICMSGAIPERITTIDAFQVLMNVRGTTCIPVPVGSQYTLDLAALVGGGNANMTITSVEISAEGKASLGMTSDPRVFANQVLLTCTKPGSAIAKVTMVATNVRDVFAALGNLIYSSPQSACSQWLHRWLTI